MEKAILKTLIYANIFDYPLKGYEVHKWLISRKDSFQKVQKGLDKLFTKKKIGKESDYYFLKGKNTLRLKRIRNAKFSKSLLIKANIVSNVLRLVPWIKLVGISGGLAMENAHKKDDVDLFIVTAKGRLWLSRFLAVLLLTVLNVRRARETKNVCGKFCLNLFISEDDLEQDKKDLYTAHEVLQMKPLWQRNGMYKKFLEENGWAFRYLPNWTGTTGGKSITDTTRTKPRDTRDTCTLCDALEKLARWFQLKYMGQPSGLERIQSGALYFHPLDYRTQILKKYKLKLQTLN